MAKSFCCFNATLPAALALSVPLVVVAQAPAQALRFRFDFDSNSSDEFQAAVRDAGRTWSSLLQDDVVVDLRIRYTDLSAIGGDVLGGAQPGKIQVSYADYVNAAFEDVVSSNDYLGVNSLQLDVNGRQQVQQAKWEDFNLYGSANLDSQRFSFLSDKAFDSPNVGTSNQSGGEGSYQGNGNYYYQRNGNYASSSYAYGSTGGYAYDDDDYEDYYDDDDDAVIYSSHDLRSYSPWNAGDRNQTSQGYVDEGNSNNNSNVSLTKAQAKALGLLHPEKRGLDGVISINSQVDWDLYREDGVDHDRYDITTVLQHEIGHALGLVSGVDALDFLASTGDASNADLDDANGFSYLTPMDFYRYSAESANLGVADLTLGGEKYFSLDGGQNVVRDQYGRGAYFSTGSTEAGGDGYQGSHWKEGNNFPLGVMNPTLQKGRANDISELDLTLLDVVGWDLENRIQKKASVLGIDWQGLQRNLASQRNQTISETVDRWSNDIPALEAAIQDASVEIDARFTKQMQDKFDALSERLRQGNESEDAYRDVIERFYADIYENAAQRNKQIESIPYEVYNIDLNVRQWLEFSTEQLSDRMRTAEIKEINRLSNIVKSMPYSERVVLEAKLKEAVAPFADEPTELVQELLDTSGPANPIGYGGGGKWWFFFQLGEDGSYEGDDADVAYYSEMAFQQVGALATGKSTSSAQALPVVGGLQPVTGSALALSTFDTKAKNAARLNDPTDIPEPSMVLGLFGIAVLGAAGCRRKRSVKRSVM